MSPLYLELQTLLEDYGWYGTWLLLQSQFKQDNPAIYCAINLLAPDLSFLDSYSEEEVWTAASELLLDSDNQDRLTAEQLEKLQFLLATKVLRRQDSRLG